jgi:hypothetical protein
MNRLLVTLFVLLNVTIRNRHSKVIAQNYFWQPSLGDLRKLAITAFSGKRIGGLDRSYIEPIYRWNEKNL